MGVLDFLTTSAVSLVVGGNTGINPCLTLFLVGCIEKMDPTLLNMEGTMENLLSSWPSLIVLGIASVLEFVSMCVPVVDEIVDSAMTVVIPIMSVLGSLSTFGLFKQFDVDEDQSNNRQLLEDGTVAHGFLIFFQIIMVISGVCLALCLHLFKMFVRLLGEGCLTGLLTCLEVTWTFSVIFIVILIKPIAIFVAACLICFAAYAIKRKFFDKEDEEVLVVAKEAATTTAAAGETTKIDVEVTDYVVMKSEE